MKMIDIKIIDENGKLGILEGLKIPVDLEKPGDSEKSENFKKLEILKTPENLEVQYSLEDKKWKLKILIVKIRLEKCSIELQLAKLKVENIKLNEKIKKFQSEQMPVATKLNLDFFKQQININETLENNLIAAKKSILELLCENENELKKIEEMIVRASESSTNYSNGSNQYDEYTLTTERSSNMIFSRPGTAADPSNNIFSRPGSAEANGVQLSVNAPNNCK